ncbi:MAG: hypothetical protein R3C53_17780 [Pirellulaceae bacterium]
MDRREFLASSATASTAVWVAKRAEHFVQANALESERPDYSDYSQDPRPDVAEGICTAGAMDGPIFAGFPVVSGPSPSEISILQPVKSHELPEGQLLQMVQELFPL